MLIFGLIVLSSLLVSAISLVGIVLVLKTKKQEEWYTLSLVGFAAGVMLTTALMDLLPEAIHEGSESVFFFTLLGIVLFFFLERFVFWFHHHDETHNTKPTAYLILLGDMAHNFIDGIAIAAAFMSDIRIGILTTIAIAIHEIPQELADVAVLVSSGMRRKRALLLNVLSALTAIIGAVIAFGFLQQLQTNIPNLLAFTSGMFLYIACSDLIPELHRGTQTKRKWRQSIPFIVGILVTLLLITTMHH